MIERKTKHPTHRVYAVRKYRQIAATGPKSVPPGPIGTVRVTASSSIFCPSVKPTTFQMPLIPTERELTFPPTAATPN